MSPDIKKRIQSTIANNFVAFLESQPRGTATRLAKAVNEHPSRFSDLKRGRPVNLLHVIAVAKLFGPGKMMEILSGDIIKSEQQTESGPGAESASSDVVMSSGVAEERRSFNRQSGLTREETELLARWLAGDQQAKALLVEWARARLDDSFQNADAAELIEVVAKTLASFLLNKRRRKSAKGPPPGG